VPADGWMRAAPVPAGRHQVRLHFHQNYLVPGLLLSLAAVGLALAAGWLRKPNPALERPQAERIVPEPGPAGVSTPESGSAASSEPPSHRRRARTLLAGVLLAGVIGGAETLLLQRFHACDRSWHILLRARTAETLAMQRQPAKAIPIYLELLQFNPDDAEALNNLAWARLSNGQPEFYPEALRMEQRACELTHYLDPQKLGNLAVAYSAVGRVDDAIATAEEVRKLALAAGNSVLAQKASAFVDACNARRANGAH